MERRLSKPKQDLLPRLKDNRPLKDKDFQTQCSKNIIRFLVASIYPHPLSLQELLTPDSKLFWTVIDFVFKQMDLSFSCKNETELKELLRFLKYPYLVNSQILSGAHNFWGHLIAIMDFAVELARVSQNIDQTRSTPIVEYCLDAYECFMRDTDASEVKERFYEEMNEIGIVSKNEIEIVQIKMEDLENTKKTLSSNGPTQKDKKVSYLSDCNETLIRSLSEVEETRNQLLQKSKGLWNYFKRYFGCESIEECLYGVKSKYEKYLHKLSTLEESKDYLDNEILAKSSFGTNVEESPIQTQIDDLMRFNSYKKEEMEILDTRVEQLEQSLSELDQRHNSALVEFKSLIKEDINAVNQHLSEIKALIQDAKHD